MRRAPNRITEHFVQRSESELRLDRGEIKIPKRAFSVVIVDHGKARHDNRHGGHFDDVKHTVLARWPGGLDPATPSINVVPVAQAWSGASLTVMVSLAENCTPLGKYGSCIRQLIHRPSPY